MNLNITEEQIILTDAQVLKIIKDYGNATIELDFMNKVDQELFTDYVIDIDYEDILIQYIENISIWCYYIRIYEDEEEYEICGDMIRVLDKMRDKYIRFIEEMWYNEDIIDNIKRSTEIAKKQISI